jgi:hypothetical protein
MSASLRIGLLRLGRLDGVAPIVSLFQRGWSRLPARPRPDDARKATGRPSTHRPLAISISAARYAPGRAATRPDEPPFTHATCGEGRFSPPLSSLFYGAPSFFACGPLELHPCLASLFASSVALTAEPVVANVSVACAVAIAVTACAAARGTALPPRGGRPRLPCFARARRSSRRRGVARSSRSKATRGR